MPHSLPPDLTPLVIQWYQTAARPLPWRGTGDPYRVWLSEIMLQQTRIEAVIPYYHRFLQTCPTVEALAAVDDDVLMKLWEGLGYYSRARNLKRAARIIVDEYGGAIPPDPTLLRRLPGIGEYTCGAISSIAFGLPEPAVDGNVLRVLTRLTACPDDIALPATKKAAADALCEIYPLGPDAGRFTEGLMEIGEIVCLPPPGEPRCADCPLHSLCRASAEGTIGRYPVKSPKKERRIEELTVFLLHSGGTYALRRRPVHGLLGGMWEFPHVPGSLDPDDAVRAVRALCPGIEAETAVPLGHAKHVFTHVEWRMTGYRIEYTGPCPFETAAPDAIRTAYAVPTAFRRWKDLMDVGWTSDGHPLDTD
ncbi:MAG: A/G-specific adenine glycosylase [Clostridiales bacterium]|nr:A/G-specific adenine glycosylase [Clostridiales bacterium]